MRYQVSFFLNSSQKAVNQVFMTQPSAYLYQMVRVAGTTQRVLKGPQGVCNWDQLHRVYGPWDLRGCVGGS